MSDEDALLAAIAANADEDTPRLAYADWLDENADSLPDPDLARIRAEFIRVQTERLRCQYWLPEYTARYGELIRREDVIQSRYTAAILGPAGSAGGVQVRFERGLPCLQMHVGWFLAGADRFAQLRAPELGVTQVTENWHALVTHPHFSSVTHMAMAPLLTRRPRVALPEPAVIGRMGELAPHNRLRGLNLAGCRVGDAGVAHLAQRPDVWRLEDLDLSYNEVSYTGLMDLLLSPLPARFRRLDLSNNPLTDRDAQVIAKRWPETHALKWIRLEGTRIGPAGAAELRKRFGSKVEVSPEPI